MTQELGSEDAGGDSPASPDVAEPQGSDPHAIGRAAPATDSIADGVGVRSTYAVNLDVFEGPLDLLLHLVRRHELDVLDIPISFIAEKYIEYISFARSLDIEVAGEYLLMAATLAFLKSRELLPPVAGEDDEQEEEEDGVDPREELIRRLIEYERFRDAGFALAERPISGRDVFPRGGDLSIVPPEPGLAPVTLFRLAEAYNRVLDRAKINAEHEVVIERVTVRQRMRQLSDLLKSRPKLSFEQLFLQQTWSSEQELRQMLVVTLMSVLEMVKLGVLGVHQAQGSDALELERSVEVEKLEEIVADFRGDDEDEQEDPAEVEAESPAEVEAESPAKAEGESPAEVEGESPAEVEAESSAEAETPAEALTSESERAPETDTEPGQEATGEAAPEPELLQEQEPEALAQELEALAQELEAAPAQEQASEQAAEETATRASEPTAPARAASDESAADEPAPDQSPTGDDD